MKISDAIKKYLSLSIWTTVSSQGEQSCLNSTFRDLTVIFFPTNTPNEKHSEATSGVISLVLMKKKSFRVIYYFSLKLNFSFYTNQTACGCYTLQGITRNPKKV